MLHLSKMSSDDWNSVTILRGKGNRPGAGGNKGAAINAARRRGEEVQTEQKYGAGQNKKKATDLNTAKLDQETEELRHDKVRVILK